MSSNFAFPLRMNQGLLRKTSERDAFLTLIGIMARTPRGSWAGHELFGFNEFFREGAKDSLSPEARKKMSDATVQTVNRVLEDLGLTSYRVESIGLESEGTSSFVLMLRAKDAERAFEFTI
jgi:hypothetical protein